MINGFILVNKPQNMTSNDLVKIIKKKFKQKKVGHSGTLDPNATGLVVIALGRATKMLPLICENQTKEYEAEFIFNTETKSYDIWEPEINRQSFNSITYDEFEKVVHSFEKTYMQLPPIFSAKKVDGIRLYEYARKNIDVEVSKSSVTIHHINLLNFDSEKFSINCKVSKGTYIRSLGFDIAKETSNICAMSSLIRKSSDGFNLKNAYEIDEISESSIILLNDYIINNYECVEVYGSILEMIKNGSQLNIKQDIKYPCAYTYEGNVVAIYDVYKDYTKPTVMIGI